MRIKSKHLDMHLFAVLLLVIAGCETVHQTTKQAGAIIGKGAKAAGGVTEGAAEGYRNGSQNNQENPYGR